MFRYSHALAWLIVAGCASPKAAPPPNAETPSTAKDPDSLLRAATAYLQTGNAARTLELCSEAAVGAPLRTEPHVLCGRAHASLGQLQDSAASYERARALGSTDRRMFAELASVYDVSKRYDEAIAVYQAYLAIAPNDAEMLQELGLTLTLLRRYDDAVAVLQKAAAQRPNDGQVQLDIGYALLQAEHFTDSAAALRTALAHDPKLSDAYVFLAQTLLHQQDFDGALAAVTTGLTAAPSDALRDLHRRLVEHQQKHRE